MSENIKLRTGHNFVHLDNGVSVVGSLTKGLSLALSDKQNYLPRLNNLLDGSLSRSEVIERFADEVGLPVELADKVINKLEQTGHLEKITDGCGLSASQQERYSRSAKFLSWINLGPCESYWLPQERLSRARIAVLGVGGIGGAVAYQMVASGVHSVKIYDADVVELSNLNRQLLFDTTDVASQKVDAAADRLRKINPEVRVETFCQELDSFAEVSKALDGVDLVFRCADSPSEMPFWVSDAAIEHGVPWIDCSYNGPVVNVCLYVPGVTGCYRCLRESERLRLSATDRSTIYSDDVPPLNAVIGPIAAIAGSLAAYEGIRYLTSTNPQSLGKVIHQNMYEYSHSYVIPVPENCAHSVKEKLK